MRHVYSCTCLLLMLTLALGAGCRGDSDPATEAEEPMILLATLPPLGALVRDIAGDRATVTVLVPPGHSPHSYEPTPSQLMDASRARAWFTLGSGVEFEVTHSTALREQNAGMTIVECSERIVLRGLDGHDHHDHHDHTGDRSRSTDPHVWTSPANVRALAYNVMAGLIHLDPNHEDEFRENMESVTASLDVVTGQIEKLLLPLEGRAFLVYHPSFGYFADEYKLTQRAIEEEGHQPGPAGVAAVVDQARTEGIRTIVVSPQYDTASAQVIADEIGGEVVRIDPLDADYVATMRALAEAIAGGQDS